MLGDAISIGLAKGTWDREDLVVSTKIHGGGRGDRDTINSIGLSRTHLFEGLQASLERLQLEYVDVSLRSEIASACSETQKLRLTGDFQLRARALKVAVCETQLVFCHRPDPRTPIEETVRGMNHLIDRGMAFCTLPLSAAVTSMLSDLGTAHVPQTGGRASGLRR